MLRTAHKQAAVLALLAGLLLRALTPIGYMPAAAGSGFLFELCPDQLPAGVVIYDAGASTHHHHGNPDDPEQTAEPDQCQIGHLLFSAVAVDEASAPLYATPDVTDQTILPDQTFPYQAVSVYQPRGPPHLRNKQITI
jgi:hypothetical protein